MKTIVHFSTSHFPNDNRIYYKEIIGAKKAGYDVSFIVAHDSVDNKVAGRTYKLKRSANKFKRYIVNQIIGVYRIYKIRPSIVQFHDPELLLSGLVLHYLLKPTHLIYDVHEDNYTGLMERGNPQNYTRVKLALAHIVRKVERVAYNRMHLVIAEKYYGKYFPKATAILNYPIIEKIFENDHTKKTEYSELIYTGNISIERGLSIYCKLVEKNKNIRVHLVGRISGNLSIKLHEQLGAEAHRLIIPFRDEFVDPIVLQKYYQRFYWTAGLAIFPESPHYYEKELTKLFEYMMNSIPVICSNYPTWENIVVNHCAGLSVDPNNVDMISQEINRLGANEALINQYGVNGSRAVQENYNWSGQEEALMKLYDKVIRQ
ncbi:MAG: glycosyltransferase family 4 protein [Candidatus Marinimicrobia bacterium]|jgi:glycosyltransferase involved in cell wall biosynthesis|nr:glycosyltransferase family 4 protein [Candidatus Neomarinimicrobiota bacterium]MBT3631459.1 glycosyltransferase family 4 protein [Candidatus Neomarinimicrobiota bacterium]MBT3825458.1 glycosyltransferase family 4 protein [Candidatus Neomarinimicrobiota bacterium]MBT4131559.1 glycosyltransferase family 4 protein [Candidatus Neomarinimicrobiota bacterium]MBT4294886.1 glycosyltransferase family 4 protein [Candidatus Neomarinimicrobiota bacterium]